MYFESKVLALILSHHTDAHTEMQEQAPYFAIAPEGSNEGCVTQIFWKPVISLS